MVLGAEDALGSQTYVAGRCLSLVGRRDAPGSRASLQGNVLAFPSDLVALALFLSGVQVALGRGQGKLLGRASDPGLRLGAQQGVTHQLCSG